MTSSSAKRELPVSPNPDHLRKQAKARLIQMRAYAPGARLGEAQLVLAREYGFPDWAALQAEVARRAASPAGAIRHIRRAPAAVLPFWRIAGTEPDEHPQGFLRGSVVMSAGVLLALLGVAVILMASHYLPPGRLLIAHHRQAS
ncbi:MAG TPA: hypothetical protein VLL04_13800 [Rhizomicrobium sp.]|nr:hypothetical protein [Rhizomicrobium sp.]